MPKARSTKRETKRPAPYNLRASAPGHTSGSMATALISPVATWSPHHGPPMWSDPHMGYQQPYHYIPVSAPQPPPPPMPQPSHPGQSAPWTSDEDSTLIDAKSSGLGWNDIHQRYFPTKSGNACRKRHERLILKLRTTDWDHPRIQRVMAEYNAPRVREEFWSRIAHNVGERWEDVEKVVCQQYSQSQPSLTMNSASSKDSRD